MLSKTVPKIGQDLLDLIHTNISNDKNFGSIFACLQDLSRDDLHSAYHLENGLLYVWEGKRMCIPNNPEAKTILLQEVHDSTLASHPGLDKTYTQLAQIAYWPNMHKHIEKYVKSCHTCCISKIQTSKPSSLLQPLPIPDCPWTHIAMDLIIHLPRTERQNDTVAIFIDHFSKTMHFVACCSSCSTQDFANLFFKNVV
jgi:hypothetical protein